MSTTEGLDYSTTVNLPKTEFPQKAGLAENEPVRLQRWIDRGLEKTLVGRRDLPSFVLHDGPPYANGDIHIGHTLNKVLKDIIVRYKRMTGFRVNYVHGSDCHGLPIEQKVVDKLRAEKTYADKTPIQIRQLCAEYAKHWVSTQQAQFKRLGVGGDYANAYITMDPKFETALLRGFKTLVEKGYIYKGLKVVHWDTVFETALAEAEIEHEKNHVSPSIYVKFPFKTVPPVGALQKGNAALVIWTTTPWTLPANRGVSLHPDFDYVAYEVGETVYVVAEGLLESFVKETGLAGGTVLERFKGAVLDRQVVAHPLVPGQDSLVILGHHVTLEQGTGAVHTAPGHGVEDLMAGKQYGLEIFNPVDERGCFTNAYPDMQGTHVFKANPLVIEKLKAAGLLLAEKAHTHSYPYSWRSRKPVIMRATEQWFMSIDKDGLREKALAECNNVQWIPKWGFDRISNMLASRPDWCLSRQRAWGIPIPSLVDRRTGKGFLDADLISNFIAFVENEGTDCWYTRPLVDFLPDHLKADAAHFDKEFNTFDVWYDSGSTHLAVLNEKYDLSWPADLYLEGGDQHRGWFQHSMWVGVGVRGAAPFRAVLTHGFVLDAKGQPMSKSLGNVINPLDVIKDSGADVLRLWVSSEDYRDDVSISPNSIKQMGDAYRKIRNTLRAIMANLYDFDPATNAVPYAQLAEDDRFALHTLNELVGSVRAAYDAYEFHRVYQLVNNYCVRDLSSLYVDITKDRLYCSAPDDAVRRASQTVFHEIASALARLVAPILAFTADEVWENLPGRAGQCVHLENMPSVRPEWSDAALAARFEKLLALRAEVTKQMEPLRAKENKIIGNSLDAAVVIQPADAEAAALLGPLAKQLSEFFIVSSVETEGVSAAAPVESLAAVGLRASVRVAKAGGRKCVRCWKWTNDCGSDAAHPDICYRCTSALQRSRPT